MRSTQRLDEWDTASCSDEAQRRELRYQLADESFSILVPVGRLLEVINMTSGDEAMQAAAQNQLRLAHGSSNATRRPRPTSERSGAGASGTATRSRQQQPSLSRTSQSAGAARQVSRPFPSTSTATVQIIIPPTEQRHWPRRQGQPDVSSQPRLPDFAAVLPDFEEQFASSQTTTSSASFTRPPVRAAEPRFEPSGPVNPYDPPPSQQRR